MGTGELDWDAASATGSPPPYRLAIEIETDDGTWVDVNKPGPSRGNDKWFKLLVQKPTITWGSEKSASRFTVSSSTIVLDDSGDLFGALLPWTLYDNNGTARTLTAWYRRKLRIRVCTAWRTPPTEERYELGTFEIERIQRGQNKLANVTLVGLERKLIDEPASCVKDGDAWPQNARIADIVKAIIQRAGKGEIDFESGSPVYQLPASQSGVYYGPAGNFPNLMPNGERNESNYYIPTAVRVDSVGATVWVAGYTRRGSFPWLVKWSAPFSDGEAFEYCHAPEAHGGVEDYWAAYVPARIMRNYSSTRVNLLLVRANEAVESNGYPWLNCRMKLATVTISTNSWDPRYTGQVFLPSLMHMWPTYTAGSYAYPPVQGFWGYYWLTYGYVPAVPVYFPCKPSSPNPNVTEYKVLATYCYSSDDTGQLESYVMSDLGANPTPVNHGHNVFQYALPPGAYSSLNHADHQDRMTCARTWIVNALCEAFQYDDATDFAYWLRYDASVNKWLLHRADYNTTSPTVSSQVLEFPDSPEGVQSGQTYWFLAHQPTAFYVGRESGAANSMLYIHTIAGVHSADPRRAHSSKLPSEASRMYNWTVNHGLSTYTKGTCGTCFVRTPDWANRKFEAVVSIRANLTPYGGGDCTPLLLQFCDLWKPSGHCYGFGYFDGSVARVYSNLGGARLPHSTAPFMISENCDNETANQKAHYYAADQGTGNIVKFTLSRIVSDDISAQTLTAGPVDGSNTWQSCPPFYLQFLGLVCGVAMTAPHGVFSRHVKSDTEYGGDAPDIAGSTPGGRVTLWTYGSRFSDVIPLADFADSNAWEALEMLRFVAGDFVMGFNRSGEFFFKPRANPTLASMKFQNVNDRPSGSWYSAIPVIRTPQIDSEQDLSLIVNKIAVPVFYSQTKQPEYTMILTPDSKADGNTVLIHQSKLRNQRITLRCISGGTVMQSDDEEQAEHPVLFSFYSSGDEVIATTSEVILASALQFNVFGLYGDESNRAYINGVEIAVGDYVMVGDGNIVEITDIDLTGTPPCGPITTAAAIGGSATHPLGTKCTIYRQDRTRFADSEAGIATVAASTACTAGTLRTMELDSTERISVGMVLFGESPFYVHVRGIVDKNTIAIMPGVINVDIGLGTPTASYTFSVGEILGSAIWFRSQSRSYEIADTGVSVGVLTRATNTDTTGTWAVGDRISITCYGEELVEAKNASYTEIYQASIERYGAKQWKPPVLNRLITPARVSSVFEILQTLKYPQHESTVHGVPFLFTLTPDEAYSILDLHLFPYSSSGVKHLVHSIAWDTAAGTMTLMGRTYANALDGYYDDDKEGVAEAPPTGATGEIRWSRLGRGARR